MPHPSSRISGIVPSGKDGWEVHFAAWSRKQAGEDDRHAVGRRP